MQAWRARSPEQRQTLRLAACLTVLALTLDVGVVAMARHLVREIGQTTASATAPQEAVPLSHRLTLLFGPDISLWQGTPGGHSWRMVPVWTMVSACTSFVLAWGLSIMNLGLLLAWPSRTVWIRKLSTTCYLAMQMGVVLLAMGMVLNACSAAQAWGSFWNWDLKEVWALCTLLWYLGAIHARYSGWLKDFGLAVCSVLCFTCVMLTWFSVHFLLKTSLHINALGSSNGLWVYCVGLANVALVVHATARYLVSARAAEATIIQTPG
jgi:ABC-type transport system involved in cytochrome c biogenesis permease subunit